MMGKKGGCSMGVLVLDSLLSYRDRRDYFLSLNLRGFMPLLRTSQKKIHQVTLSCPKNPTPAL